MPSDLPIRCTCGALRGVARQVSPKAGNRVVCYCDDCQSFAHFLGRAEDVLDVHGGTDIFQLLPPRLEITEGIDNLACLRLRPGGLHRWYASCCNTPIANTMGSGKMPFAGMIDRILDPDQTAGTRDETLGPVRAGVQARFAKGDRSTLDASDTGPVGLIARFLRKMTWARLRGHRGAAIFFDPKTRRRTVEPRVLSEEELSRTEAARDAA